MVKLQQNHSTTVEVRDLPEAIDSATILSVFGAYGEIHSHELLGGGKARIVFGTHEMARWMCDNLSGNIPQGLTDPIVVEFYPAAPAVNRFNSFAMDLPTIVEVIGLPEAIDSAMILSVFGAYGEIHSHKLLGGGKARIDFATNETARWMCDNLVGNIPQGLTDPIVVGWSRKKRRTADHDADVEPEEPPVHAGTATGADGERRRLQHILSTMSSRSIMQHLRSTTKSDDEAVLRALGVIFPPSQFTGE